MKKIKTVDGLTPWKFDHPLENIMGSWADKSALGKRLYVTMYRIFDREYYINGIPIINAVITKFKGEISEEQRKVYFEDMVYSLHRFGCKFEEYFLFNFSRMNAEGRNTFITDKIRYDYYVRMNKMENRETFDHKDKAYAVFGKYYGRELVGIRSEADREAFYDFIQRHERFIVKPVAGSGGKGIYVADAREHEDKAVLFDEIISHGPMVVEELIKQSAEMGVFEESCVHTLRIRTVKVKDEVIIFYPQMITGLKGAVVNNAHQGGIIANFDAETGVCYTNGFDEFGHEFIRHPNSGVFYPGFRVPRWEEAAALARELAMVVPGNNYIGWDLALTDDGWVMVEGNPRAQFYSQIHRKFGFKQELDGYIAQM